MFADMQRDYHRMKEEYEEVVREAAKYREGLNTSRNELKGATEVVTRCKESLFILEKEKEYVGRETGPRLPCRNRTGHCKLPLGRGMP